MPEQAPDDQRYTRIARSLSAQALGMAVDASPYRPRAGEARLSMLAVRPAARLLAEGDTPASRSAFEAGLAELIGQLAEAGSGDDGPLGRFVDGAGHRREVYGPLVAHQVFSAIALDRSAAGAIGGGYARRTVDALLAPLAEACHVDHEADWDEPGSAPRVAGALWRSVAALEGALLTNDHDAGLAALGVIGRISQTPGPGGALHPQSAGDTPDAWVYRELTGLHALHLAAQVTRETGWAVRCRQVAAYHLEHTQPDYTTYQPWALAVFAEDGGTAVFAEQQLHDVQTHLAIEGAGGALLPGLLLADAAASLSGRMVAGWSRLRFQG
jgi:hypothetical protein